jgi:hypothetical protein
MNKVFYFAVALGWIFSVEYISLTQEKAIDAFKVAEISKTIDRKKQKVNVVDMLEQELKALGPIPKSRKWDSARVIKAELTELSIQASSGRMNVLLEEEIKFVLAELKTALRLTR